MDVSGMTLERFFLADYERMRKRVQELEKMLGERVPDEYGCFDMHKTFSAVKVSIDNAYYLHYPEYGFTSGALENALNMTDDELWAWGCTERRNSSSRYSTYTAIRVEYHRFQYTLRFRETRIDHTLVTDGEDNSELFKINDWEGDECLGVWQDIDRLDYIKRQALEYLRGEIRDSIPKLREKEEKADE